MITNDTAETKEDRRKRQLREAKKRQRAKESGRIWTVTVKLTTEQLEAYGRAHEMFAGNLNLFAARALVTGAKFLANSGNVKGGKARLK